MSPVWASGIMRPYSIFNFGAIYILFACLYRTLPHLSFSLHFFLTYLLPYLSFPLKIDLLCFQAGCCKRRLNHALVFMCLFCVAVHFFWLLNACFCCGRFSFFHAKPRDWLGVTSPKWPILCRVGRKIQLNQSVSYNCFSVTVTYLVDRWLHWDVMFFDPSVCMCVHACIWACLAVALCNCLAADFYFSHSRYILNILLKLMLLILHSAPVKNTVSPCFYENLIFSECYTTWVVGCWHGYLSGARCRIAYGPAEATATHRLLLQ